MPKKVLALTKDGELTYCSAPQELRGVGRCNHVDHQRPNESTEQFLERVEGQMNSESSDSDVHDVSEIPAVSKSDISEYSRRLDEVAGCHVTAENLMRVLSELPPEKVDEITKIGFEAAPQFSLPVSAEEYEQENVKTKLYFANLAQYGVSGKASAVAQMFDKVGKTPVDRHGKTEDIEHSYSQGLTPHEYFARQYYNHAAMVQKSVGTAAPGYAARKLFYAMSDTQVMADCGGPYIDAMHCRLPNGHVCVHCAHATRGGEAVKEGELIGGKVSTALSEGLTQLSMEMKHPIWEMQPLVVYREGENGVRKERHEILWKDLQVGDFLPDGSGGLCVVQHVEPWDYRRCFELEIDGNQKLVASDTHLVRAYVYGKDGMLVNDELPFTQSVREQVIPEDEVDPHLWVAAQDLYMLFHAGMEVYIIGQNGKSVPLLSAKTNIDMLKVRCVTTSAGHYAIGDFVSHNTGTGESMSKNEAGADIRATLDGWGTSSIVQKMREQKTTMGRRQVLYEGLKQQYHDANVAEDDFWLMMAAKKLTSYKRSPEGIRPVEDDECCDIVSCMAVGSSNNIFKSVELTAGYRTLTSPTKQELKTDAANQILN